MIYRKPLTFKYYSGLFSLHLKTPQCRHNHAKPRQKEVEDAEEEPVEAAEEGEGEPEEEAEEAPEEEPEEEEERGRETLFIHFVIRDSGIKCPRVSYRSPPSPAYPVYSIPVGCV